ncbi:MAG: hemolysin III family protein [Demequinaceae bacterium]|nr:hemolysin III family protein [Demequinaceae bacterium]
MTETRPASTTPGADQGKPLMRGWLHLGTAPVALLAGLVLVALGPTLAGRLTAAVFTITAVLLFGMSALYHRGNWDTGIRGVLRRIDHANIFLIIAGTYTPLTVMLLPQKTAIVALSIIWVGAIGGLILSVLWVNAPRWLYVPLYLGLGWVAVGFMRPFYEAGGPAVLWLVAGGGLAYTVGAIIYGTKWPNPSPRYFGFHELFHALTIVGYVCHYIAAAIAILRG